ncbi:MAG TPA: enoyl-CoA hydratase-related protein [bacterium]|nr:enoyl-CoA hydratase-related protein [bacterium]
MAYETMIVEKKENRLQITLNRPPVNALNAQVIIELGQILDEYGDDVDVRSIIITGAGEKAFCAGADLKAGFGDDPDAFVKRGQDTFSRLENCGKPVIAAINGITLGGGCELALSCTFRFIAENAIIGLPESSLGIIPGYGGTQRLARVIGKSKAIEMMMFGKHIKAEEAVGIGLADRLCAAGTALAEAEAFADQVAARAPIATAAIIDAANRGLETDLQSGLDIERANFLKALASEDAKEGISAFLEKRKADFKGK